MNAVKLLIVFCFLFIIADGQNNEDNDVIIAEGKMPNMVKDKRNNVHIVYGSGDSVMYVTSKNGKSFDSPALIAVLPKLFASATRGPQIAASDNGITVTACKRRKY